MNVPAGSSLLLVLTATDALGNPATLQSVPQWASSNTGILNLTVATDGMSATGTATESGSVTVTATADGLTGTVSLDVVSGQAVTLTITVTVNPPAATPGK